MPAFDEAFANMFRAAGEAQQRGADIADRRRRMEWEQQDRARALAKQSKIDAAMNRVRGLSTDGVVEQGAGDVSAGGLQQVMADGYGGATGVEAAQQLGADSYREAQRGMRAPGATAQTQVAGAQVLGLAQNGPKVRKAKESEILGATADAIMAYGTPESVVASVGMRERARAAGDDELIAGVKLPKMGTPEFAAAANDLVTHLNTNHKTISIGEPDKNGFRQLSVVGMDGKAAFEKLSSAEQLKLMQANALMERNPTRAMQMIESVNRNLAEALARESGIELQVGKEGNDAAYRGGMLDNARAAAAATAAYHNRSLGLQEKRAEAERWKPLGATADGRGITMLSLDGQVKNVAAPEGVDTRTLFPKQASKTRYNENTGFYENERGEPVARHDPNAPGGMGPLNKPVIPKTGLRAMTRAGVDAPITARGPDGVVRQVWRTPEGDLSDDPAEAERAWAAWEATADTVNRRNTAGLRRRGEIPDPRPTLSWANPMPASERVEQVVPQPRFR